MSRRLLVTGAGSGLGRAMLQKLGGTPLMRDTKFEDVQTSESEPYDAIVHCAVNTAKTVPISSVYGYLDDNLLLTQRLLGIPHRRFVYVSTIDVYGRGKQPAREDSDHDTAELPGLYTSTKLFSEALVRTHGSSPLILRPTTLMGLVMRPNSTYRLLTVPDCRLFLSSASSFNYVLHRDIAEFVEACLQRQLSGIFNVGSASSLQLGDVAAELGLRATFGSYDYTAGSVDQAKAARILPAFGRSSRQTLNAFIDELGLLFVGHGRLAGSPAFPASK